VDLHRWDVTPKEAVRVQEELAGRVVVADAGAEAELVAGVDVHPRGRDRMGAVVCVLRLRDLVCVETAAAEAPTTFPYVPGLLAFREGPAALAAFARLRTMPDVVLWDAHGVAHPRRLGLASHMGLWLGIPSIGVAKSPLCGRCDVERLAADVGAQTDILDAHDGRVLGVALRTRHAVRPVYVSVGHLTTLETAIATTLRCAPKYRTPVPLRLAHAHARAPGVWSDG
jgi:deoxyribonuclease V